MDKSNAFFCTFCPHRLFGELMMLTVKSAVSGMNYDVPGSIFGYIGFFYMILGAVMFSPVMLAIAILMIPLAIITGVAARMQGMY